MALTLCGGVHLDTLEGAGFNGTSETVCQCPEIECRVLELCFLSTVSGSLAGLGSQSFEGEGEEERAADCLVRGPQPTLGLAASPPDAPMRHLTGAGGSAPLDSFCTSPRLESFVAHHPHWQRGRLRVVWIDGAHGSGSSSAL